MRKIRRYLAMLLAIVISLGTTSSLAAASQGGDEITPLYVHAAYISASLSISQTGLATCGSAVSSAVRTDTMYMSLQLQKKINGTWSTVKTWSDSSSGYLLMEKSYYVTSGYDYRTLSIVSIYSSSGTFVEKITKASPTKHF